MQMIERDLTKETSNKKNKYQKTTNSNEERKRKRKQNHKENKRPHLIVYERGAQVK